MAIEIYQQMKDLANEFLLEQTKFENTGIKSAAAKARMAANNFKKLTTDYKKQSVADCKK